MIMCLLIVSLYNILLVIHNPGVSVGLLRMYGITLMWQLPIISMGVTMASFITILTGKVLAIPLTFVYWFTSMLIGGSKLVGNLGFKLMLRHNTIYARDLFMDDIVNILLGRGMWIGIAMALVLITVTVYDRRRKGRIAYGKV